MKGLWLFFPLALLGQPSLFEYNRRAPIDLKDAAPDVKVRDVTFASASSGRAAAYLVTPPGKGKFAGILYAHWYESTAPDSNRTQFLAEAVTLVNKGAVSLLVETMWSNPKWFFTRNQADDYENSIKQVKEFRRALDVLLAQPGVDPERVAFVGHDFGAMYGAVMASVDRRPKAWVLIAGTTSFSDWYLLGSKWTGEKREKFIEQMAVLDPVRYIGLAAPAPVLFQFGRSDRFVPVEKGQAFFDAAKDPKQVLWYDAGHALNEQAPLDRMEWLQKQLKLSR